MKKQFFYNSDISILACGNSLN